MQRKVTALAQGHFDLLVCGGGIYGAWTAYDAALRGLKVLLIDQGDWAAGTSSASSKLIHGGLRYLESLDFLVVKKSLKERQLLLNIAPHRVWPLRFGVPLNCYSRLSTLQLKLGLTLYDLLAGILFDPRGHQHFKADQFNALFPALETSHNSHGYSYLDAQTDDARLTLEVVAAALNAGAICINHCQLKDTINTGGRVSEAVIFDQIQQQSLRINISTFVNTSGSWLDKINNNKVNYRLTKGVHLLMPKLPQSQALLLTAKQDGRVFFVIPWYGLTLLGTTDTDYNDALDRVDVLPEDIHYLLDAVNFALNIHWTKDDIQGRFAGLRVLNPNMQTSPSAVSRDWQLNSDKTGVFLSLGGKLTSAREDAVAIVDAVCHYLGLHNPSRTHAVDLPWKPQDEYSFWHEQTRQQALQLGIDEECTQWLLRRHGNRVPDILQMVGQDQQLAERLTPSVPLIYADFHFCLQNEMVVHLEDLLRRRLPLLILYRMTKQELSHFASLCAQTLDWPKDFVQREIAHCADRWLWPD